MGSMFGFALSLLLAASGALFEDPVADTLIRKAMAATYHLDLEQARSAAKSLQTMYPDHPAGFLIHAETYWWQAQSEPKNEAVEKAYFDAQKGAEKKAEDALKAGKYLKTELLAYLASAHGSYARFQVTQKEAFFSAMRAGLRAHKYAEQAYELDPNYYDIYVGLGAFNYFTGTLPGVLKPFAWLLGARGNKDLGVQQLQTAMEKARYSRTEARIVYYTALLSNGQFGSAFPILEKLIADYPDNFVLYQWVTEWHRQQRKNLEGADYFERVYGKQISRSPLMAQYALLEKATLQAAHGRKSEALQTIERMKSIPGSDRLLSSKVESLEKDLK